MKREQLLEVSNRRPNERGAALITAVLLSMLLLAAGGILILTTSMTGVTARDSTAEMQAYYAAEAGVSQALEVLRGNVISSAGTGTRATFHNVACSRTLWTATSGNTVNVTADGSSSFQVIDVLDPDDVTGSKCGVADYKPERLRLRVLGFGPRFAQKKLEVVISRFTLNYPVNAVVTIPNTSGTPINFILGDSNVTSTYGTDAAPGSTIPPLAAYAIDTNDEQTVNNVIDGCDPDGSNCGNGPNVDPPDPLILTTTNRPSFLKDVQTAREFLYGSEGMEQAARNQGRYFTTGAAAIASPLGLGAGHPDGAFTFVDGDLELGSGNPTGEGTLIVTGNLTLKGDFQFNGVIMVLGAGNVQRSGGGHGDIFGALFVAKFAKTGSSTDTFQAPTFDTNGGGTANIQYNSFQVDRAKSVGGHAVLGVREY